MITNKELLQEFFKDASDYLGRPVKHISIREKGIDVPKLDELTTDAFQYAELFQHWEELRNKSKLFLRK